VHWPDLAATQDFARALARQSALAHALLTLEGELGAGKTTLVRHLLQALGVQGRIKSPSYALVECYAVPGFAAWHCDFYRFRDAQEWEDAGLRDLFSSPGLKLVEWPQQAGALLPRADLHIRLQHAGDTARSVELQALSALGLTLLRGLAADLPGAAAQAPHPAA